jgi:2-methylaconitate cis-trans-isomerase PrpF
MGGGYSSVSKVAIIGASGHEGCDVDYEFAQVLVEKAGVDYGSNCGNMLAVSQEEGRRKQGGCREAS